MREKGYPMSISKEALINLKASINADLNRLIAPDCSPDERMLIDEAFEQLKQIAGRGGSARSYGETKIIELVEEFKETSSKNPWPVRKYLDELESSQ